MKETEGRRVRASIARYHPNSFGENRWYASRIAAASITMLKKSKKHFIAAGLRITISEFWSWFRKECRDSPPNITLTVLSPFVIFVVLLPLCGSDALRHFYLYRETCQTVYLVRFKELAVFPFWYLFGSLNLFILAAFFTALFERVEVSRRLAVSAFVLFLCFVGVSFWCGHLSAALHNFDDVENAIHPSFYFLAPPVICVFALLWGWHVSWLVRHGRIVDDTERTMKGEGL